MKNKSDQHFKLSQVGFVVTNIERVVERFEKLMGIGPAKIVEYPIAGHDPQTTYRGMPATWKMRLGFVETEHISLEFIQPIEGENIFTEFLRAHGPGMHHLRFNVMDFDREVQRFESLGYEKIASGNGVHHGSRWAFFDTSDDFDGLLIELRTELSTEAENNQWIK